MTASDYFSDPLALPPLPEQNAEYGDTRLPTRFWDKVALSGPADDPETHYLWTAGRSGDGYGEFWLNGRNCPVHRFAFTVLVRPLAVGETIDHRCRVPGCVRPGHLGAAFSNRVNVLRGSAPPAVNARATTCVNGHPLTGPAADLYTNSNDRRECRRRARKRMRDRDRAERASDPVWVASERARKRAYRARAKRQAVEEAA